MHPVEEYQVIMTFTVDRLNECEIVTSTRRWTLNYYITQCTGNSIRETRSGRENQHPAERPLRPLIESWGSDELEIRCGREKPAPREAEPQAPSWAAQENRKETLIAIRVGVNMFQFCSISKSLLHTTLSIKWEVYFSENCVALLYYCVVVMILHACRCICVCIVSHGHGYITQRTLRNKQFNNHNRQDKNN